MPKTRKSGKTPADEGGRHRFLTTGDVARLCGVTRDGVGHWIRAGKLPAFRTPGGHFRVRAEDLRAFLRGTPAGRATAQSPETKVLVVDDEAAIRSLLSDLLVEEGFQVQVAADARQALNQVLTAPPALVITDISLPGTNGTDLVRLLRQRPELAGIPIIAVTGVFDHEVTARIYAAGVDLLLAKPFRPDHLLGEVRRLLGRDPADTDAEARP